MKVKKVCIVAYNALSVIAPSVTGYFGGLKTCSWLIARRHDTDVTFVVRHHRKRSSQMIDGVNVVTRWEPLELCRKSLSGKLSISSQFPWLRLHRWDASLALENPFPGNSTSFQKRVH